jgi:ribonuclease P protein component
MHAIAARLQKHADYQRVYERSRKQFSKHMSYFYAVRLHTGANGVALHAVVSDSARVGLTVGKVMGKAVDRNRIRRRMREVIRQNLSLLHAPVDVVLHPRRSVIDLEFGELRREMSAVFRSIQRQVDHSLGSPPSMGFSGTSSISGRKEQIRKPPVSK